MRTLSEIAYSIISNIYNTLPEVDTKEGTFIRDVFINPISKEISDLYIKLKEIQLSQSILTASDSDLDNIASNFFIERKKATKSTGIVRFYIGQARPTKNILIPQGSLVSTSETEIEGPKYFSTLEAIEIFFDSPSTYAYDQSVGQYYSEALSEAEDFGESYNVEAGKIVVSPEIDGVFNVINPFSFTGGSDGESDISLAIRVSLALTGANIGTKDGYRSFILEQEEVIDAKVIGAGEELMLRDGGKFQNGVYIPGIGGMVDIYVRAEVPSESQFNFNVDYNYIVDKTNVPAYADILLPNQPVLKVYDIVGVKKGNLNNEIIRTYVNGTEYEIERGSGLYYEDILWNSSVKSKEGLSGKELAIEEAKDILSQKLSQVKYLTDASFNLYWNLINPSNDISLPQDESFSRGYYTDGLIYIIRSKDWENEKGEPNIFVGGRFFIKRDGKLYERIYIKPDFILIKDKNEYSQDKINGNIGMSVKSKDAIRWLSSEDGSNLPLEGEILTIKYNWNRAIKDLQSRIDENKILTADVLIRQSEKVKIEIRVEVELEENINEDIVKNEILTQVSNYIDDFKKLGGEIDKSYIVYLVRGIEGVKSVNINNVYLSKLNQQQQEKILLTDQQYMESSKIEIKVI